MSDLDNDFWRFSLAVYSKPEAAAQCLTLQDTLSANVNALLFCAWLGAEHAVLLDSKDIASLRARDALWQAPVVRPLRSARRHIKTMVSTDDAILALRKQVMDLELKAEQIEQAQLYAARDTLTQHAQKPDRDAAIRGNVANYLAALADDLEIRSSEPPDAGAVIAAALAYRK